MKLLIFILCLSIHFERNEAVSCDCNYSFCPSVDNTNCKRGVAKDICGCCTICAGDVGEHCGGPWGIFGRCGEELECQESPCPETISEVDCYLYHLTDPGKCVEKKHKSIVDILQGTHINDVQEKTHSRRMRLLKELESIEK